METSPKISNKNELIYNSGVGRKLYLYRDVSINDYKEYLDGLKSSGYTLIYENEIEGNLFSGYMCESLMVYTGFFPCDNTARIVFDENKELPEFKMRDNLQTTAETTLWQFEVDHRLIDCGMCYIIRCCDNSFFIVDSAHPYSENDCERLHTFLRDRTPQNEIIVISGWFFSHGHIDHIGQFLNFLEYYSKDVVIEKLYFNFIPNDHRDGSDWCIGDIKYIDRFYEIIKKHPDVPVCTLHTGETFYIRNLKIDSLCSHEDIFPNDNSNYNDSSVVLMITAENTKFILPGDAGAGESEILEKRYPRYLKSDIAQCAHHAHFGTSVKFYELVNAPLLLIPTTQIKFDEEFPHYEANKKATELSSKFYIASNGTVEIPLPYTAGAEKVFPDETFESFSGVYNLWGYEYNNERKKELYNAYLSRGGKSLSEYEGGFDD